MHCICDSGEVCEFGGWAVQYFARILFTVNVVTMLRRAKSAGNKELNANAHIGKCFDVICAPFGWQHVMVEQCDLVAMHLNIARSGKNEIRFA